MEDFLGNVAAELAATLVTKGAGRLRDLVWGTAEQRALERAWGAAFAYMLLDLSSGPAGSSDSLDEYFLQHIAAVFQEFLRTDDVAVTLLDVALVDHMPPLALLEERFTCLEFDQETLPIDFQQAMTALTAGLAQALLKEATEPNSPLHNRVHLTRLVALQQLCEQQQGAIEKIAGQLAQLDAWLRQPEKGVYNLHFFGPATGFAIGDGATAQLDPDLRPLLEQVVAQITRLAAPPAVPPYTPADRDAYLEAVIAECQYIRLPYVVESGRATIPLREIYVALKADRSSPVERKASHQLFQELVHQATDGREQVDDDLIARLAALDPYAGRFLIYDPQLRQQLLAAHREEEERTYDLAEILRQHRWLVLLGDPGSGKSTLARWLALHLAEALKAGEQSVEVPAVHVRPDSQREEMTSLGIARLPVLIRLADYAATRWPAPNTDKRLPLRLFLGQHLAHLLEPSQENRAMYNLVKDYLAAGRVTFILDGLDEVTDLEQRQIIAGEIEQLTAEWVLDEQGETPLTAGHYRELASPAVCLGGNQLIVTSRIVGYQLRPLHENLPHFVIQPMEDPAVTRFCHNWAAATGIPDKAEALLTGVLEHPNGNVREQMARNPLLLTILAQVFSQEPEVGLPVRRAELYHKAQIAVFTQRSACKGHWRQLSEQLPERDVPRVLARLTARIAYELHANPNYPNALADKRALQGWLREAVSAEPALQQPRREDDLVEEVLKAASLLSGFFVERGEGVYGFLHRQFQEYFAALYLVQQVEQTPAADEVGRWQPLASRLANPNWQEVILLAVGIVERETPAEVTPLLTALLDAPDPTAGVLAHNLLLIARTIPELRRPPKLVVQRVAAGLIAAYQREDADRFAVLQAPVEAAFAWLPHPQGRRDPVGEALCEALSGGVRTATAANSDIGRFRRLAAVELILEYRWFTPAVTRTLAEALRNYGEPAAAILLALEQIHQRHPAYFQSSFLPVRRQWKRGWATAAQDEAWAAVLRALYLSPAAEEVTPEGVVRDSLLTSGLQQLLEPAPAEQEKLLAWLQQQVREQQGAAQRDAGLALWYLGDGDTLLPYLQDSGSNKRITAFRHSLVALAVLAHAHTHVRNLDLDRARDLALALDLARPLDLALDHALARARNLARDLARDRARDLAHSLFHAHALARDLAHALAHALALARGRDLAHSLDLAFAVARDLAHARSRSLTRARDLALTLDQLTINLSEVEAILANALAKAELPPDLRTALEQAQRNLTRLRGFLAERSGPWQVWRALGNTLAGQQQADHWFGAGRIRLSLAELQSLPDHLAVEQAPALLPRLDVTTLPVDEQAPAQTFLFDWWQTAADTPVRQHIALLLAETGTVQLKTLPLLLQTLQSANDLTRYRTQLAIERVFNQPASYLGRDVIEALAHWQAEEKQWLADTYQSWALNKIRHNRPEWLQIWLEAGEKDILGHIHSLTPEAWPVFQAGLATADPTMQVTLLGATSWLLRLDKKNVPAELSATLLRLAQDDDPAVQQAACTALGFWPQEQPAVLQKLLALAHPETEGMLAAYLMAVARLAAQVDDSELVLQAKTVLRQHSPTPAAWAALARLLVGQQRDKISLETVRANVAGEGPPVGASLLLPALLQAGTDDDHWNRDKASYHEAIARLIGDLVQEEEGLLEQLLATLQEALEGGRGGWPARRIALAAVAHCAATMPDALNSVWPVGEVTTLLLAGTQDAGSFNSRRHGILALSRLRILTPEVLAALLAAGRDVPVVQQDATTAAGNFRHLHADFGSDSALNSLAEVLQGESGAAAYLAARVLGALGSSPAVLQVPGLRERIAQVLSVAYQNERAQEIVYLLLLNRRLLYGGVEISEAGTRAQVILEALRQVWGMPGG